MFALYLIFVLAFAVALFALEKRKTAGVIRPSGVGLQDHHQSPPEGILRDTPVISNTELSGLLRADT